MDELADAARAAINSADLHWKRTVADVLAAGAILNTAAERLKYNTNGGYMAWFHAQKFGITYKTGNNWRGLATKYGGNPAALEQSITQLYASAASESDNAALLATVRQKAPELEARIGDDLTVKTAAALADAVAQVPPAVRTVVLTRNVSEPSAVAALATVAQQNKELWNTIERTGFIESGDVMIPLETANGRDIEDALKKSRWLGNDPPLLSSIAEINMDTNFGYGTLVLDVDDRDLMDALSYGQKVRLVLYSLE